ncbi:Uncharacterised protein [Eubacterium limosum]|uniref:Uncharacterized protein n=1 Tax=Eubacterium limosum TaxID=1736 RepID=A0A6N3HCR9_EUBLI
MKMKLIVDQNNILQKKAIRVYLVAFLYWKTEDVFE